MSITVIVPAFNEAQRIGVMLEKYLAYFSEKVKFLVVLNGCIDNTEAVVKSWQEKFPQQLDYIVFSKSKGKGHAVRQGFKKAKSEIIGFVDADGSTSPAEFAKLLTEVIKTNNDVVIASRYAPGSQVMNRDSYLRRLSGFAFHKIVKLLTGLRFYDTQCGAKVFKQKVITDILPDLQVDDMTFDVEILLQCKQKHYKVKEIPTIWQEADKPSTFLTSNFKLLKTSLQMFWSIINIKFRYFFK